jgi:ribosome-associated translation inhibitor RaiA
MEPYITVISISLSAVNGLKGGFDKRCQLRVSIANMEDIVIKDTQTDLYCAIDRAMQRASRSLARKIVRQ